MRNSMKVAKWEIKRNLKNKTFLIGLFLTPLLIVLFGFIGSFIGGSSDNTDSTNEDMTVYVQDEIGIYETLEETVSASELSWTITQAEVTEDELQETLEENENTAYLFFEEENIEEGMIPVYTSEGTGPTFQAELSILENVIMTYRMNEIGVTPEQASIINQGVHFQPIDVAQLSDNGTSEQETVSAEALLSDIVPVAFAAIIFVSILFTGMAIFQSASQEKKDKIAEILLSSLTPNELMQGKIMGYFVLGLVQAAVLLLFIIPFVLYQTDIPIFQYLFVPETLLYLIIAVFNYLMFAALLVGIGATMEDISTAGNFQGLVMMLPFLPFLFITPVMSNPSGLIAQIGSYIPFTAPGVLLMRLATLDTWPWIEIIISLTIIVISAVLFIKLAGKIFKVGILMYGKNATPGEIWKWLKA